MPSSSGFRVIVLGDLHYDRLKHHDMDYVRQKHGEGDVRQIENYSRLTRTVLPRTFRELRQIIRTSPLPVRFVIQLGDFVQGLCGRPDLARRQCQEATDFVRNAELGIPFLITKGNHDITGPGAAEAYDEIIIPYIAQQLGTRLSSASFVVQEKGVGIVFLDAYKPDVAWLEASLRRMHVNHRFLVLHPPVVPTGARALWHLFARDEQRPQRERLLDILGRYQVYVLCGHLHKWSIVGRRTYSGHFIQMMFNSVIPDPDVQVRDHLSSAEDYNERLLQLEPRFEPQSQPQRRAALLAEQPFITHYQYADAPGYAIIDVTSEKVIVHSYVGLGNRVWNSQDLSLLRRETS